MSDESSATDQTPSATPSLRLVADQTSLITGDVSPVACKQSPGPEPVFCFTCDRRCEDVAGFSSCCNTSLAELDASEPAPPARAVSVCTKCLKDCEDHAGYSSCCAYDLLTGEPRKVSARAWPVRSREKTSHFKGVGRHYRRWRVSLRWDGKMRAFGHYATEEAAARVYDNVAFHLHAAGFIDRVELNFPEIYADPERCPPPFLRVRPFIQENLDRREAAIAGNAQRQKRLDAEAAARVAEKAALV